VFELAGSKKVESMDIPYSIALSNDRLGFVGVFDDGDIACARWLADTEPPLPVHVDYLGMSLMIDYTEYTRGTYTEDHYRYYILLHSWNMENDKMIFGWHEASREYMPLPDLTYAREVYREGNAIIYEVDKWERILLRR